MTSTNPARPTLLPIRLVSLLLLIALGAFAADLTWQLAAPMQRPAPSSGLSVSGTTVAIGQAAESPLLAVAETPLFGTLGARPAISAPIVAPETRLRLRLLGLAAGDTPSSGRAIIAEGSGTERVFTVGATLGNGQARLHAVYHDHVVLERSGQLETLRLPRLDGTSESGAGPSTVAMPAPQPPAGMAAARVQRSEWLENPERLLQSIRARPITREGALYGLEVRPTRNARQFQEAGLQPGDIITSVAGIPLAAIDDPMALLSRLSTENQVDITIERHGEAIPLSVQLY